VRSYRLAGLRRINRFSRNFRLNNLRSWGCLSCMVVRALAKQFFPHPAAQPPSRPVVRAVALSCAFRRAAGPAVCLAQAGRPGVHASLRTILREGCKPGSLLFRTVGAGGISRGEIPGEFPEEFPEMNFQTPDNCPAGVAGILGLNFQTPDFRAASIAGGGGRILLMPNLIASDLSKVGCLVFGSSGESVGPNHRLNRPLGAGVRPLGNRNNKA
jgi:hypothetical protein